jgi:hypothetical protein
MAAISISAGCGSGNGQLEQNDPSRIRMQTLAISYSRYLAQNGGKMPASEAIFKKYIARRGTKFLAERGIKNVDELFLSPRDGQPLVVSYGTRKIVRGFSPDPIVAHEQTGVGGKRLVAFPSGAVIDLDPVMFDKLNMAREVNDNPPDTGSKENP